jgi:HPt (histidine-containing phosphotransfer) domain-containing protein
VIIALTAEESPEMLERFCQSGFQEVLAKPIDPQRLHQALERWIPAEQRQTLSEPVLAPEAAEEDLTALAVEGIDLERVAQSKTKAQYLQLLALFSREGRRSLPLWQTVEREQLEDYRIWVHGVKSASANIGAMEVSALAREQENAAKAGDLASVQAGRPALFAKYGRLLEEIDRVVQAQTADGGEEGPALDGEALLTELRQALDALEHFRSKESAKVLEHLLRCRIPAETREILQQVREKLRLYEDDDAEDQLREMITKFNAKECHGGLE